MDDQAFSAQQKRSHWWLAQRNDFGLPNALYAPRPIAVILVLGLGAGSSFIGLFPGANTHEATLSGVGAPWIGLIVLLVIAGLWYWRILRHGYSPLAMGLIVAAAVVIDLAVNALSLEVLVDEQPDAFIGALGAMGWLITGLLLLLGLLFEWFLVSMLMGTLMGLLIGGLAGFSVGFYAMLIMMVIYGPIGALAGGLGGLLRPVLMQLRQR